MRTLLFAALLGLLGCPRADPRFPRPRPLDVEATGLSGLTVDGEGALWAVPEDARSLLRIEKRKCVEQREASHRPQLSSSC